MKLIMTLLVISTSALAVSRYGVIVRQMEEIQQENPHMVELVTLGKNDQGVDIVGMKIEGPSSFESEKDVKLVVGTHHGNESDTAPLSVQFSETLIDLLNTNMAFYADRLKDSVYYVFPVLNISGYDRSRRHEADASGRWLDPNRDYPDACVDNPHYQLASIRALADFVNYYKPSSAITVHGYVGSFTYPWGFFTENDHTPDHDSYIDMASFAVEANNYRIGTHKEVLYAATGSFEDWAYLTHGTWTMLVEMSRWANFANDVEMMLRFLSVAPRERSKDHMHYGSCSESAGRHMHGPSRP